MHGFNDIPNFKLKKKIGHTNLRKKMSHRCEHCIPCKCIYTLYYNDIIGHAIMLLFILIMKSIKYNRIVNK